MYSSMHATTFDSNHFLPLPPPGIPSPYDVMPSLPQLNRPTALGQDPSDISDWKWPLIQDGHLTDMLPSSLTLPAMSCHQDVSLLYDPTPPFSPNIRMSDGELVSSPATLAQDLPPFADETALRSHPKTHSFSASPISETRGAPQLALEESIYSPSGKVNSTVRQLRQRKYSSRSQTYNFSPAVVDYEDGYRLDKIKRGVADIIDQHGVAFPDKRFAQKASFRLEMKGYKPFTSQLNVNTTSGPPTRLRFAKCTAKFMQRFIKRCHEEGEPFPYQLRDLVLVRIDLVSEASVQPVFDIVQDA